MDISILKQHLGEELYGQVSARLEAVEGLSVINLSDGSWVPKARFEEERGKVKSLSQSNATLTHDLEEARKESGGLIPLKEQLTKLQSDLTERDNRIATMQRSGKVLESIRAAKARNPETVLRLIDMSKISEDKDGKLTGVEEQLEALKTSDPYFFQAASDGRGGFGGGRNPNIGSSTAEHSGAMNYSEVNAAIRAAAGR